MTLMDQLTLHVLHLKKKKLKLNQSVSLTVTSVVDFQKQNPTLPNPIPQVTNPEYDVLWYP